jgi:hypothetical protein
MITLNSHYFTSSGPKTKLSSHIRSIEHGQRLSGTPLKSRFSALTEVENLSGEFNEYLDKMGTVRKLTIHDTPEYNGVAERLNHTLLEKVWAMLHASGLPKNLWGEAVMHAVYLKNRTSTRTLKNKTPFEMLTGKKPNIANLCEFGTKV